MDYEVQNEVARLIELTGDTKPSYFGLGIDRTSPEVELAGVIDGAGTTWPAPSRAWTSKMWTAPSWR